MPRRQFIEKAERQAARFPPLLLQAGRLADGVFSGRHGRRRSGVGESFWQFRPYTIGETTGNIDWRQSAKRDSLFVREREWQATKTCWLWRDRSASMDYASRRKLPTKGARADLILLALAVLLAKSGERFGWYGPGIKAGHHREGVFTLADRLARPSADNGCFPDHHDVTRGATAIFLGDFLGPIDAINEGLRRLAGDGIHGYLVRILDPAEHSLPFSGRVRFENIEDSGGDTILAERVESLRGSYRARVENHAARLRDAARRYGWQYLDHDTSRPAQTLLLALYERLNAPLPGAATASGRRA